MIRTGNEKLDKKNLVLPVAAATKLNELTIAALNESGYAVPGNKATGLVVAGCVQRCVDNSAGANGGASVEVRRGTFVWDNDGTIQKTDVLKMCYIAGPTSVTKTADGSSVAGRILAVEDDGVTVDMSDIAVSAPSAPASEKGEEG